MHKFIASTILGLAFYFSKAQSGETIITELGSVNQSVVTRPCNAKNAAAISNRAMNVFLADKTGYVSESTDLSLYTNYVTLNTIEGQLTVNHNFQKAAGIDEPIRKLFSVGVSVNIANEISAAFLDKKQETELGLMLGYKWLGKVKTQFADCAKTGSISNQKQAMDALRAALLQTLILEIKKKEAEFKTAVESVDIINVPGQDLDTAKAIMLDHFYKDLKDEYNEKFAKGQAEILTKTNNFKRISTGWTSITTYIPIVSPTYTIAEKLITSFQKKHSYPLSIMLSHTRLWESTKTGRLFLTLGGKALVNNSKASHLLSNVDFNTYKSLGGIDTTNFPGLKNDKAYLGQYETFITPSLNGRLVYFPPGASHVGVSIVVEQNFGKYNFLRGKLGIPVVLINSKKLPAANFEFYAMFFDITNSIESEKKYGNKTTVGVNVGIPFSRLMY